jgi:hypothetical protein
MPAGLIWRCTSCEVAVSYAPGHPVPDAPAGWTEDHGSWRCLACGREAAVEAALAAASPAAKPGRVKGEALARFELLRNPERTDAMIAKVAGTYAAVVGVVRSQLLEAGEIAHRRRAKPAAASRPLARSRSATRSRRSRSKPAPPKPRKLRPAERADAELRRDPTRSNPTIAAAAGVGVRTVARRRAALRAAGAISDSGEVGS